MHEGTATSQTSTVATDEVLSGIFSTHSASLTRSVFHHLDRPDWHLAEDIAQEAFLRLVRSFSGRPIDLDRVGGLLRTIARRVEADHFRVLRSTETPVDTSDWFEARRLPVDHSAEDYAIADLTARAMLADSPAPLAVAA